MNPCESCSAKCEGQFTPNTYEADGLFIAQMELPKAGMKIAQHSHAYDHLTMVTHGRVRCHGPDGDQDFAAPFGITIPANVKHQFTALSDGVFLLCIHNTSRQGRLEMAELATVEEAL